MKRPNGDRRRSDQESSGHPDVDQQFRFFTGEMEEGERRSTLHHLSQCSDCRGSFESRRREFRDRIIEQATERGYLPPDRSGLRERVFQAVARDRANRKSVLRRTILPLHPRMALVAAAALILVAIGVRYLGDSRWNGRLLSLGGAQLLVTDDGDRFVFVTEEEHEVGPGDLVLVLPGPEARIELPGGGSILLPGPALVALDTEGNHPKILVARGYVEVRMGDGPPVAVNAAGREFTVDGTAEFSVEAASRNAAFEWARGMLPHPSGASFFPDVYASTGPRARVTAHSRSGTVAGRAGVRIRPGQVSTFREGARGTPPIWIGDSPISRPDSGYLDEAETRALRALLVRTAGDREELALTLERSVGQAPSPACLAAWLLGEIGHPDGAPPLRRVLDARPLRETPLRSAAAASLVRLADDDTSPSPWDLVHDEQTAVAEAALLACTVTERGDPTARLNSVFDDEDRPSTVRVLAAALLRERGQPVSNALLYGFLTDEDPNVAALTARTLARQDGGPALLARYLPASDDELAAVILSSVSGRRIQDAKEPARAALERTRGRSDPTSRRLFAAALEYLGLLRVDRLDEAVGWALREGDSAAKRAALAALLRGRVEPHRASIQAILSSSDEPTPLRLSALRHLHPVGAVPEALLGTGDEDFEARIRSRLLNADDEGARGDLARPSLDYPRTEARVAAWTWLGRHDPDEAIVRGNRWFEAGDREDADTVVAGLSTVSLTLSDSNQGGPEDGQRRDQVATILRDLMEEAVDRPAVSSEIITGLGRLARGPETEGIRGSTVALAALRDFAGSTELPRVLRVRAAMLHAEQGRADRDLETIQGILTGPDEPLAAAVALSLTISRPPAPFITHLRSVVLHPRARARLVVCHPFDPEYAARVLDTGDPVAVGIVLHELRPEEVRLVREAVARRLEDETGRNRLLAALLLDGVPAPLLWDQDPWVRITAIAVAVRADRLPEGIDVAAAVGATDGEVNRSLETALADFAANPGKETAVALLSTLRQAPPVRAFMGDQGKFEPPPRNYKREFTAAWRLRSRLVRREFLNRMRAPDSAARRAWAVNELSQVGVRKDLTVLFRMVEDETNDVELRRAAIRTAADLLSRRVDVADPGPALSSLRAWWSERSLAFTVPVLPR